MIKPDKCHQPLKFWSLFYTCYPNHEKPQNPNPEEPISKFWRTKIQTLKNQNPNPEEPNPNPEEPTSKPWRTNIQTLKNYYPNPEELLSKSMKDWMIPTNVNLFVRLLNTLVILIRSHNLLKNRSESFCFFVLDSTGFQQMIYCYDSLMQSIVERICYKADLVFITTRPESLCRK